MSRAFVIAIGVVVLTLMGPAIAHAKPRVAIVAFDGDSQGALQDVVIDQLQGDVSLVGARQVTRAMDKLELSSDMGAKQLKKLAKELEADSIVRGDVSKSGSHKVLHVKLFVNGKRIKGFKVEFGSAKSEKFKAALKEKLLAKLGVAEGGGEEVMADAKADKKDKKKKKKGEETEVAADVGAEEAAAEPPPDKKDKKKKGETGDGEEAPGEEAATSGDDEDPNAGRGEKKVAAAGDEGDNDEIVGGVEPSDTVDASRSANRAAVRVNFGPSFSSRSLKFTSRSFEEAPRPYANSPVPGGRLEGELYPLAFSKPHSFIGGIGIGGDFDQTAKLSVQSTVQMGTKFPVTQKHFSVGPRIRLVFGHKPTSPSVTLSGGYMSREFKVDRKGLVDGNVIDLPDVGYKGYNAGLAVRFPVTAKIAIMAAGRGIFVTTTGAIQTQDQYGQAKVSGVEGGAGIDVGIGKRMAVSVVGEFTQMGFTFMGNGQMSNNRDGDPATQDVGGAADRWLGATVLFGVLY